ncbi:adenosylcobyric acid synthase (glutamine-hydrolysing) [[Eubacterium] yurii]|jgi:cobyric acid synthase cobQ|nr:adenosylcobyric acid synthase (glutamine-hydrolysing) [[Eubacterium] yurii]
MSKSIMFVGTNSSAGKSLFVTAMCRVLSDRGYRVAPFKSQNMALNSYIDKDGNEFGRAQAIQAFACRINPSVYMNPILLKPNSDRKSQVILLGKKDEVYDAKTYYQIKSKYLPHIRLAYEKLEEENDVIVLEGAGSPAEINLLDGDFVNMGMSEIAKSPVILVADIDKGGVFASIYGTIMLTPLKWRSNYKGIIINKFRGDVSILQSGIEQIEEMLGIKVISVMPYIDVDIEEEDSLNFKKKSIKYEDEKINISILKLKNLSNFTDISPLKIMPDININYVQPNEIDQKTDLLIIPASKNVIDDLNSMSGWENIKNYARYGNIIAVANGVEFLCQEINDEEIITRGIGIFDAKVKHCKEKIVRKEIVFEKRAGLLENIDEKLEINYVKTSDIQTKDVLYEDDDGVIALQKGNTVAFCGFGIFENSKFINQIINNIRARKNMKENREVIDFSEYREEQIAKLAEEFERYVDIDELEKIINNGL